MNPLSFLAVLAALVVFPHAAAGQSTNPTDGLENLPVPDWARAIIGSFDKPLHPLVGGVASGGGLGGGAGYSSPDDSRWFRSASGLVTIKRYWMVDAEIGREDEGGRSRFGLFGEIRDMNRLEFYGLGPSSVRGNRAGFALRESVAGARGWFKPVPAVRVGGIASVYVPNVSASSDRAIAPAERIFSEISSAFQDEPTFGRYRGFMELTYPGSVRTADTLDKYRGAYQVAIEAVRDHSTGRYDFNRLELETKHILPGIRSGQHLTLHAIVAGTQADTEVPFYLLYTLGGNGGLKSFRPDMLGSDGTAATMRSFRNYRFRDRSLLLMQAEYRVPLTTWLHSTVFVDAGQVAPRVADLFRSVLTGTGFSLSYMRKNRALARVDVGFGSGEGIQMFWSFGNVGF